MCSQNSMSTTLSHVPKRLSKNGSREEVAGRAKAKAQGKMQVCKVAKGMLRETHSHRGVARHGARRTRDRKPETHTRAIKRYVPSVQTVQRELPDTTTRASIVGMCPSEGENVQPCARRALSSSFCAVAGVRQALLLFAQPASAVCCAHARVRGRRARLVALRSENTTNAATRCARDAG